MSYNGILNLNKPTGMTSRRVVDVVQRLVRPDKVGHAGTLDPLASGVLVVCVGSATRLIEYVQKMPKRYRGTFLLGRTSPTEDIESEVTLLENPPQPTLDDILRTAVSMTGEIQQRPPSFSALKVDGQRAYDLAREGKLVEFAPRPVTIHGIQVVTYNYPELVLEVQCGGGTYIRSLGRDLARALNSDAVMSALVRSAIGEFQLGNAFDPEQLTRNNLAEHLLPLRAAVADLPMLELNAEEIARLSKGLFIRHAGSDATEYAGIDAHGRLIALLHPRHDGTLGASRNFAQ